MTEKRVQFSTIVKNQFPGYVDEEYPLSQEFFSQYYKSVEYQGGPTDILQNIDEYVKLDNNANIIESTTLTRDVDLFDAEIFVLNTVGFPDSYGLVKIDNEIVSSELYSIDIKNNLLLFVMNLWKEKHDHPPLFLM